MNDLNSVLIEGTVGGLDLPFRTAEGVMMSLSTNRFTRVEDKMLCKTFIVSVTCSGSLADRVMDHQLKKGRRLRVVGRLDWAHSGYVVVADHIELLPNVGSRMEEV